MAEVVRCDECDGWGTVRKRPTNAVDLVPCPDCHGTGERLIDDTEAFLDGADRHQWGPWLR